MSTPFSISGVLTYPPDDGKPAVDRDFSASSSFDSKTDIELNLTGSGTKVVDMGTITTGAKAIQIEVAPSSANPTTPVNVRINASTDNIQITPGGGILYFNPSPQSGGITALTILYTVPCVVRVRALG